MSVFCTTVSFKQVLFCCWPDRLQNIIIKIFNLPLKRHSDNKQENVNVLSKDQEKEKEKLVENTSV